jgi:hypothetical protein
MSTAKNDKASGRTDRGINEDVEKVEAAWVVAAFVGYLARDLGIAGLADCRIAWRSV